MKNILVTGAHGQLGQSLKKIAGEFPELNLLYTDYEELDITSGTALQQYFTDNQVDYCINCAAYTAVDKAESDEDKAYMLNFQGPLALAEVCTAHNAVLVQISTDYVFSGKQNVPYRESDEVDPQSVYGSSKMRGEAAVTGTDPKHIIVRTAWLYSEFAVNFAKRMKELMAERPELNVVFDQAGTPTYACDLAKVLLQMVQRVAEAPEQQFGGVYHYSNEGVTSWYDFAVAIKELTGATTVVNPITSDKYPTPAQRPAYSVFNKEKIRATFGITIPYWRDSLKECLSFL
ncbi:dTDP-4-dehydrorhamnose reductase [Chitinophaga sp. Cy-1792]|uniref:dTDP-4-dehydrorhamnose reductase n=1 Tax=Chitinophaga sp. Cy-1792 TaxID=2608339 RepID=UPI0014226603|nr:dTDP-4-dehydrorhamnose reductase [Chitinophaga sp. Cy-1792]NIG56906.1 dTDP-4-dehydrorhamnose reductase [Chitinophaga sp. Cy-1792]